MVTLSSWSWHWLSPTSRVSVSPHDLQIESWSLGEFTLYLHTRHHMTLSSRVHWHSKILAVVPWVPTPSTYVLTAPPPEFYRVGWLAGILKIVIKGACKHVGVSPKYRLVKHHQTLHACLVVCRRDRGKWSLYKYPLCWHRDCWRLLRPRHCHY